ncbi:hypothetical protein E4U43_006771, partial [Claviceps pusilla]
IDWEWVGSDNSQVQTNYFTKGDTTTYDRGAFHPVDSPTTGFHTYGIEWTSKAVNWMIDGKTVRTLSSDAVKGKFPQTPMQIKLGTWCAGGANSPPGTRQWAGGYTDFSKAPFNAYYKSISVVDYAGKDSPAKGGVKEYIYGDMSGSWQSIKVVGGTSNDSSSSSSSSSSSLPSKPSSSETKPSATGANPSSSDGDAQTTMTTATASADVSGATSTPSSTSGSSTSKPATTSVVPGAASRASIAMAGVLMTLGAMLAQMV